MDSQSLEKAKRITQQVDKGLQLFFKYRDKKIEAWGNIVDEIQKYVGKKPMEIMQRYNVAFLTPDSKMPTQAKNEIDELYASALKSVDSSYFDQFVQYIRGQLRILALYSKSESDLILFFDKELIPLEKTLKKDKIFNSSDKSKLLSALNACRDLFKNMQDNLNSLKGVLEEQIKLAKTADHDFFKNSFIKLQSENKVFLEASKTYGYQIAELAKYKNKIKVIGTALINTIKKANKSGIFNLKYNKKSWIIPIASGVGYGIYKEDVMTGILASLLSIVGLYIFPFGRAIKWHAKSQYEDRIQFLIEEALGRPHPNPVNFSVKL